MKPDERLAWFSVVVIMGVLLFWSLMAYDALAQHVVKLNYVYEQCIEVGGKDETQI